MKAKYIIINLLIIVFFSCSNEISKKERTIRLKYTVKGEPIFYETQYASIVFDKNDVIKDNRDFLNKYGQHYYRRQVFLDYLLKINDTITLSPDTVFSTKLDTIFSSDDLRFITMFGYKGERDTIIQVPDENDVRNLYVEPMFWSAYELIRKGKCEITSKIDLQKVKKIKVIYYKDCHNTRWTKFFFENDTLFFGALTQMGF